MAQQELFRSLYGREETPPRWKFCVAYGNGNLGNSVGSLFVRKYFDEQSKADVSCSTYIFSQLFVYTTYSHVSKESIYRKKVEGWTFERIIKHIGLKWSK